MINKIQTARQPRFGFDRNSPLGRFWRWWSGELIELIPQWLRQSAGNAGNTLLVEINPQAIVLRRWLQDKLCEQGRLDLQSGDHATHSIAFHALITKLRKRNDQVALCLSNAQCMVKQIELPLAAVENLRQVLSFEMDRHTPYKADQVYFDFRVSRRDSQNKRISVKMVAAPRLDVDASLDLLTRWSLPAQAVHVFDPTAASEEPIDLMPVERRITKLTTLRMVNLGLLGLAVVLCAAAIAIPIWQKRHTAIAVLPLLESAKQQAEATDVLRREWEKKSTEYNFVLEKKQAIPPVVVQLEELARLLPDDTWVQQYDLKGKEIQIQGETVSSSKLIALLESSKMLRDASFRSPLTKGMVPNSERFHLGAEVKPLSAAAIAALKPAPVPPAPVGPVPPAAAPAPVPTAPAVAKAEPAKVNSTAVKPGPPPMPQPTPIAKPETRPILAPPTPNQTEARPTLPSKPLIPALKPPDKALGKARGQEVVP